MTRKFEYEGMPAYIPDDDIVPMIVHPDGTETPFYDFNAWAHEATELSEAEYDALCKTGKSIYSV